MVRILFFTDSHITGKLPSMRIDKDIHQTFINKMQDVYNTVKDYSVDVVIHGGDLFHTPDVSNRLVGSIAKIINKIQADFEVPVLVVPGNHDLQGQNIETLPFTKLGLLDSTSVIKICTRETPFCMVDKNTGHKIKIEFQEYYHGIDTDNKEKDYSVDKEDADVSILVTHSMLMGKPFLPQVNHTVINDINTDADLVLSGHYHEGITPTVANGTLFINPGSSFRVDYTKHNQDKLPQMILISIHDDNTIYFEFIPFKSAKPFNEVFNVSKKLSNDTRAYTIENFNKKLKDISITGIDILNTLDEYVKENKDFQPYKDKVSSMLSKEISSSFTSNEFTPSSDRVNISKVILKNFQKHEHLEVDFTDGVNIILGSSNAGKTSILRAINWVLYNTPKGNAFIRTGASSCSVTIHFSNGFIVTRSRSKTSSGKYSVYNPITKVTNEYKGFSNSIPIEITNIHQMPEITVVDKKYKFNIANQLEGAFMLGVSSQDKMNMIGALADTDNIDKISKQLKQDAQKSLTEKKVLEKELESVEISISEIGDLTVIQQVITNVERLQDLLVKVNSNIDLVNKIKTKRQNILYEIELLNQKDIQISDTLKENIASYKKMLELYNSLSEVQSKYTITKSEYDTIPNKLTELNKKIETLSSSKSKILHMLEECEGKNNTVLDLKRVVNYNLQMNIIEYKSNGLSNINNIKNMRDNYINYMKCIVSLQEANSKYDKVCSDIRYIEEDLQNCINNINILHSKKQEIMDKLKGYSYVCSECGSVINY